MSPQGAANARFRAPAGAGESAAAPSSAGVLGNATALSRARAAVAVTEVALKRLQLDERRGGLVESATPATTGVLVSDLADADAPVSQFTPAGLSVTPTPNWIDIFDPWGVSCTTRKSGDGA
jgi:hypothetical protein